jgi:hypothetical protein
VLVYKIEIFLLVLKDDGIVQYFNQNMGLQSVVQGVITLEFFESEVDIIKEFVL